MVRAYGFIKELNAAQATGIWAAFHFLICRDDHTGGSPPPRPRSPTTTSRWATSSRPSPTASSGSNTVIFVIEDDPQSGYDHVDGHRSLCLVISPYTKRNQVVSTFYNQSGVSAHDGTDPGPCRR